MGRKLLFGLFLVLLIGVCQPKCFAADQWAKDEPLGSRNASDIDLYVGINNEALDRLLTNYKQGADLSYSSATTISVAAGEVVCSNSTGTIRKMRKNTSATSVTFSDLDTGSEAASTTYYVYAVADTDAETFTIKISASSTSPTGATYYLQLGSFYNDADSDIVESSVYANNFVNMDSDGRLPYANSIVKVLHATDSTISSTYADMDGGGQWQSFDVTLSSTSTILVIGAVEISSNNSTIDGYIQVVYGSTQIAEAFAGGDGAAYPAYEKASINGIATNVSAGTYTIKAQLKAGSASINTLGKIYCTVYIIPE